MISELLDNFTGSTYDDFLKYFYFYYNAKMTSEKSQNIKNKYIKAQKNILSYILTNKQKIVKEISNRKNR